MRNAARKTLIAALLALIAAAGAPLAHVLRVAEVAPATAEAKAESREAQYRLVLASDFDPLARSEKSAESKKNSSKSGDVRLLKVLDDQWEASARVEIGHAEIPQQPRVERVEQAESARSSRTFAFVLFEHSPPNPPARGPPL